MLVVVRGRRHLHVLEWTRHKSFRKEVAFGLGPKGSPGVREMETRVGRECQAVGDGLGKGSAGAGQMCKK